VTVDSIKIEELSAQSLAQTLRTDVSAAAEEGLRGKVEQLAAELEKQELEPTAIVAIGSEIALRCALVGVSFDFSNLSQILN
jgi:post-segregation antitoxin (ccd killing protein)